MAVSCAFLVTACAASKPSTDAGVQLPALPASMMYCPKPVTLPTGDMTQEDVERFWGRDRLALSQCGITLDRLVKYYQGLASDLSAIAPLK